MGDDDADAKLLRSERPRIVEALRRQLAEEFPIPRYSVGIDHGIGPDASAVAVCEREPGGRMRVVSVTLIEPEHPIAQHYALLSRGWTCPRCGVFVGEEHSVHPTCRSCEAPRPA